MNTIEEFENAPIGATATSPNGNIAFKTGRRAFEWAMFDSLGYHCDVLNSDEMGGFTLDPGTDLAQADLQLQALTLWTVPDLVEAIAHGRVHIAPGHDPALTAPTSAREALDLVWELAHEVKEGQTIPGRERTIGRYEDGDFFLGRSLTDRRVTGSEESHLRTLDPLPDPVPDWLDAPAVIAFVKGRDSCADPQVFSRENKTGTQWLRDTKVYRWTELVGVVPLYPKDDTLHDAPRRRTFSFRDDGPWGTTLGGGPA